MAEARARARMIRISPRKVRLVADLVRGKKVPEALDMLSFTVKGAAPVVRKILASAVANAESKAAETNQRIDTDEMVVSKVLVNDGPTLYRMRAAPRRRAVRIRKRTCHIDLMISGE
jgi:large subunit ribosomal protein L22